MAYKSFIGNPYLLSDETFAGIYPQLIAAIEAGKYCSLEHYLRAFIYLQDFCIEGIIGGSDANLLKRFKTGIKVGLKNKTIETMSFPRRELDYLLRYTTNEGKENQEKLLAFIENENRKWANADLKSKFSKYLNNLNGPGGGEIINKIGYDEEFFHFKPSVFSLFSPEEFADAILRGDVSTIQSARSAIDHRYKAANIRDFLNEDLPYLIRIESKLKSHKPNKKTPLKEMAIRYLIPAIAKAIQKLSALPKGNRSDTSR